MQKAISFDDVAIVSVKGNDYKIHFWYMMKPSNLNEKSRLLYIFSLNIKDG